MVTLTDLDYDPKPYKKAKKSWAKVGITSQDIVRALGLPEDTVIDGLWMDTQGYWTVKILHPSLPKVEEPIRMELADLLEIVNDGP